MSQATANGLPEASKPAIGVESFTVECNTSDDVLKRHIRQNSALALDWVRCVDEHDGHAVICGSGPSLADMLPKIKARQAHGQKIFALNGAAKFLKENGVVVDYQVMVDARAENKRFLGHAEHYLLSSQCHPNVVKSVSPVTLWHSVGCEDAIPERDCEYDLIGGGTTVGLSSMCLVYALGYRFMHLYGYDSSHREDSGHAFKQSLNKNDPLCYVSVGDLRFKCSLAMAKQAELFPILQNELLDRGCTITIDGDGLLPAMIRAQESFPVLEYACEQDKYRAMWERAEYRRVAPGESVAAIFCLAANPKQDDLVIDFGSGTGRGALKIQRARNCKVQMLDFVDNCLDDEVRASLGDRLKFDVADLTNPISHRAKFGYCTDVMEHIEPENVTIVLDNIFQCVDKVFFQISTVPDQMGQLIGHPLHLTVQPLIWWQDLLSRYGTVEWFDDHGDAALFYVTK